MSVTSGFFNSSNGDRRYSAEQFASMFDGILRDGVFMNIGRHLMVKPGEGLSVKVSPGKAWFNHTWTYNDSDFVVQLPPADVLLPRHDAIVLEVNTTDAIRTNTFKVVSGTPASSPVYPKLKNENGIYQHPLAHVKVKKEMTTVLAEDITNSVGTSQCPFVTGVIDTVDVGDILNKWAGEAERLIEDLKNNIQGVQDGSAYLFKTGDKMSGPLKMAGNAIDMMSGKITNVAAPENDNDAVTLKYLKDNRYFYIRDYVTGNIDDIRKSGVYRVDDYPETGVYGVLLVFSNNVNDSRYSATLQVYFPVARRPRYRIWWYNNWNGWYEF